jgi:hypothetical protein
MSGITYALLIGVESYHETNDFPNVDYAKRDVEGVRDALKLLQYDEEDFFVLLNEKATKTTILQKVKKVTERCLENDRIIFYFAGHGFYEGGRNLLAPVDAVKTEKGETCISIDDILEFCKRSRSQRIILFLDCCHSGLEGGADIRGGTDSFMADELIYQFSREQYCVGFASCKSNEKSISHSTIQHGVWSYFLINALSGEAAKVYQRGLLFSDELQTYLNKETSQFVKMNTVDKLDQTPIKFGSETDKFVIADINPILEEKVRKRKATEISIEKISFFSGTYNRVKNLPGFQKGHIVPTYIGSSPNSFIKEKGHGIIEGEISRISKELKEKLGYKRKDIRSSVDKGAGSIETNDFDYSIELSQAQHDPGQFVVIRRMENITNDELLSKAEFNAIFAAQFDNLVFDLSSQVDINELIDAIESLENDYPITVEYDASQLDCCIIRFESLRDFAIEVCPDSFSITTSYKTSPDKLISSFKLAQKAILSVPDLKMIGL